MTSQEQRLTRRKFLYTTAATTAVVAGTTSTRLGSSFASPGSRHKLYALAGDDQTLRIAINGTQVDPTNEALAETFKERVPGAQVEFIPLQGQDWNEYFSKILTMIAAGTTPDLTSVATEGTQLFAGQGLAAPIDEYVQRDAAELQEYFADVHPSLVEAMMYEGNLYQLPFDWNAANMYLNTKVLNEHGLAMPGPDWTRDDFYALAKALTKEGGGPPFGYGFVNRLWGGWMPWIFVNDSNLLTESRAPGGEWLWQNFYASDPTAQTRGGGWRWEAPQANAPANVEALQFMVQLAQEKIMPAVEEGGGDLMQGFFTNGSVGMTPAGGFWAGSLHNAGMSVEDFDVQLFPKWKTQRHQFGVVGLVMLPASEKKDLAWEYMKHYVSKPTMETFFTDNPTTPARRSMMTDAQYATTGPKQWSVFYDTLDKHPDTAPIPAPPVSNEMTSIYMKYTSLAMTFQQEPQEALDNMQRDLEALFAK